MMLIHQTWAKRLRLLFEGASRDRARRAEDRQRAYQVEKALRFAGSFEAMAAHLVAYAGSVRRRIEHVRPINPQARVLEVGSGAHGLIFFLGLPNAVGVDPLADLYRSLFPQLQQTASTVRGYGEKLPFDDASFDLVLCDNVIDHAERPAAILEEIARVLRPAGMLYFTVHVHHPIYAVASALHAGWNALGVPFEIGPFADHTVHFTLSGIRTALRSLPIHVLSEDTGVCDAKMEAEKATPRHAGDRLKRFFFKNARFEIVAVRTSSRPSAVPLDPK